MRNCRERFSGLTSDCNPRDHVDKGQDDVFLTHARRLRGKKPRMNPMMKQEEPSSPSPEKVKREDLVVEAAPVKREDKKWKQLVAPPKPKMPKSEAVKSPVQCVVADGYECPELQVDGIETPRGSPQPDVGRLVPITPPASPRELAIPVQLLPSEAAKHERRGDEKAAEQERQGDEEAAEQERHGDEEAAEQERHGDDDAAEQERHGDDDAGVEELHGDDAAEETPKKRGKKRKQSKAKREDNKRRMLTQEAEVTQEAEEKKKHGAKKRRTTKAKI